MRAFRTRFAAFCLLGALCAAGATQAQQVTVCSDKSGSGTVRATCFGVATTTIDTYSELSFGAWLEFRDNANSNNWSRVPGTIDIREGSITLKSGGTRLDQGEAYVSYLDKFNSVGTHVLYARSSTWPNSPVISVTVDKFTPRYAMGASTLVSRVGQSIQLQTHTEVERPNGVVVFFVKPPGGVLTEYARKPISYAGHIIDNDVRTFSFASPFITPGEYAFSAQYLGDAFNHSTWSTELVKVRVGPFVTSTALAQSAAQSLTSRPVTLTATITGAQSAVPTPTGNVEFYDGATLLGSAALSPQGTATLVTTRISRTGPHSLTARYTGDFNYQASTSGALSHETRFDPALLVPILDLILQ
jgi:hypothetical protein